MSKKITLSIIVLLNIVIPSIAQERISSNTERLSDFNTWDFGIAAGLTFPRTDISGKGFNYAFSLDATKYLSRHFALQTRFIHGVISGEDVNRPEYKFNTTINYDLTVNAVLQSHDLILLPPSLQERISLFVSVGAGVIHYSPDIWLDGGYYTMHGIYSQYSQQYDTFDYSGSTDFILPVSFGAKYRLSNVVSITAEYSYRMTNSDKLDGFFKLLSANDNYSFFNAGIIFHLGKKNKSLEWESAAISSSHEIDSLKTRLRLMSVDSDNDGVPDIYDKEPSTPAGVRVYGDGKSVDTDNDGVPDYLDVEPFSAKNAKVDASGKEIHEVTPNVQPPVHSVDTIKKLIEPVFFGYDSAKIGKQNYELLGKIAEEIKNHADKQYIITGIYDNGKSYNQKLSMRRAEAVKNHLVKYYNIQTNRLTTEIKYNSPDPDPAVNRRVEVKSR